MHQEQKLNKLSVRADPWPDQRAARARRSSKRVGITSPAVPCPALSVIPRMRGSHAIEGGWTNPRFSGDDDQGWWRNACRTPRLADVVFCIYIIRHTIEFDPGKRAATFINRGLDMATAGSVFEGPTLTITDDRWDFGEPRFIAIGRLGGAMVVVVWTPRGRTRRIISMRKANDRERQLYGPDLD